MLDIVKVEKFKSWKHLQIKLGRVTGIFGTNSSGKSSILQFLLMLKQTKNATDRGLVLDFGGAGQLVNLGSYEDLIHSHDTSAKLTWRIDWSLHDQLTISDPTGKRREVLFQGDRVSTETEVYQSGKSLVCDKLRYEFGGHSFSITPIYKSKKN